MFNTKLIETKKRFFYLLILLFAFYILLPYLSWHYNDFFLNTVLGNFPEKDLIDIRIIHKFNEAKYILNIFNLISINLVLFLNLFLFIILIGYFYFLINIKNENENKLLFKINHNYFYISLNILLTFCLFLLFKDVIEFIDYIDLFEEKHLVDWRGMGYEFFRGKKQTHYVVGSIISVYLLTKKFYKIPLIFLSLLIFIEFASLSRFYMFQTIMCIIIFCHKKYLKIFIIISLIIVSYRLLLLSNINAFFANLLWEPISIWCTEIVKILNAIYKINHENLIDNYIIKNLSLNFIFFDKNDSFYIFEEFIFKQFGTYSNFGLIDFVAYPLQHIVLILLTITINNKIFNNNLELNKLILIVSIFSLFKILRGSSLYGLSFILKFQILILFLLFGLYLFRKLQIFKSSS